MLKRVMTLGLLLILALSPSFIYAESKGTDLIDIDSSWAKDTILWGVEKGLVTGYPDGTFKPNQNVSESEFLAMIIRAYKPEIKVSNKGHWADNYYQFAKEMNYPVKGLKDQSKREAIINRQQVAELVSSTQGVHYDGDLAIRYLLGYNLAQGKDPSKKTIESYDGQGLLSRAEAVQFIRNVIENGKENINSRPEQESIKEKLPLLTEKYIGNAKVIPSKSAYPLKPYHEETTPLIVEFVKSVYVKNDKIYFTVPTAPRGYSYYVSYNNMKSGDNGFYEENPSPKEYSTLIKDGGYLRISYSINGIVKSSANIYFPQFEVQMGNKGEWYE